MLDDIKLYPTNIEDAAKEIQEEADLLAASICCRLFPDQKVWFCGGHEGALETEIKRRVERFRKILVGEKR